jgi:hypothetical protein
MRRLALAIALACILSGVARAGEMHSTGAPAPPTGSTTTAPGEIPTTGGTTPEESNTVLTIFLALNSIVR